MKRKVRFLIWAGLAIIVGLASRIDGGAVGPVGASTSLGFRMNEGNLTVAVMTAPTFQQWEFFAFDGGNGTLTGGTIDALIWMAVVSGGMDGAAKPILWSNGRFVLVIPLFVIFLVNLAMVEGIPAFRAWRLRRSSPSDSQEGIAGQDD